MTYKSLDKALHAQTSCSQSNFLDIVTKLANFYGKIYNRQTEKQ
jgi:hypothetical protein